MSQPAGEDLRFMQEPCTLAVEIVLNRDELDKALKQQVSSRKLLPPQQRLIQMPGLTATATNCQLVLLSINDHLLIVEVAL